MKINKGDFINKLKETADPNQSLVQILSDPQKMNQISKNLDDFKNKLKDIGVMSEDIDEGLDMGKDYTNQTDFYRDMIDQLMNRYYKITYYKEPNKVETTPEPSEPSDDKQLSLFPDNEKQVDPTADKNMKPISQMSDSEFNDFLNSELRHGKNNLMFIVNKIKAAEEKLQNPEGNNVVSNPLRIPYLALQDTKKTMEEVKINEEKFVNSDIFHIIAESELPKISKQEIIEFLKSK